MTNKFDKGDRVRLKGKFTIDDVETDPTYVTLLVQTPALTHYTYTYSGSVSRLSTGIYYKDLEVGEEGQWFYRFVSSGTVVAAGEDFFIVTRSEF